MSAECSKIFFKLVELCKLSKLLMYVFVYFSFASFFVGLFFSFPFIDKPSIGGRTEAKRGRIERQKRRNAFRDCKKTQTKSQKQTLTRANTGKNGRSEPVRNPAVQRVAHAREPARPTGRGAEAESYRDNGTSLSGKRVEAAAWEQGA